MTASILHAAGTPWAPHASGLDLSHAYLDGVEWTGVHLEQANFTNTNLARAHLDAARLGSNVAGSR